MRYYMIADTRYIYEVGFGMSGEEISEGLYWEIMDLLKERPATTDTIDYHLTVSLNWEPYQVQPVDPGELDAESALAIILGEAQEDD